MAGKPMSVTTVHHPRLVSPDRSRGVPDDRPGQDKATASAVRIEEIPIRHRLPELAGGDCDLAAAATAPDPDLDQPGLRFPSRFRDLYLLLQSGRATGAGDQPAHAPPLLTLFPAAAMWPPTAAERPSARTFLLAADSRRRAAAPAPTSPPLGAPQPRHFLPGQHGREPRHRGLNPLP